MNKKFFAKITSFMMAICMMFVFMGGAPVHAMENNYTAQENVSSAVSRAGSQITVGEIPWAQTYNAGSFIVHNYTDMYITASTKANTHRMVVKPFCLKYSGDPNQSGMTLKITLYRNGQNKGDILVCNYYATGGAGVSYPGIQSQWFDVNPGETVMLRIDASTTNSSQSTGSYRYADIARFEIYCD